MTCQIPYIEDTENSEEVKETLRKEHNDSLKELLAFKGLNFESLKRRTKKDGEFIQYVLAPTGKNKLEFDAYVEETKHLKNHIKYTTIKNKEVIVIDVIGTTELSDGMLDLFAQEHNLRHTNTVINTNEDLESILGDEDNRKALFKIMKKEADKVENLLADPDIEDVVKNQLREIQNQLRNENFIYSVESASNFIRYAISFAEYYGKKFEGSKSYIKQLAEIEKLPTFDERKKARAFLNREVDYIKNKFYIFGTLSKIADELSFASTELDDVFETYNRYTIQTKLEKLTGDEDTLKQVKRVISGAYKNKLELKDEISRLNIELTSKEIDEIIDSSVFESMIDSDGKIKQTLLGQVKQTQDRLTKIRNGIKTYMMESQVDLLYDTYQTYLPKATTTYAKKFEVTKQKIKDSILQANGSIGMLDYNLKQGDQLPDEVLSLFTTLLHSTLMESEYLTFNELQRINSRFEKFKDKIDEYSALAQTYTFEIPNKGKPQYYKSKVVNGKTVLYYIKQVKDELGHTKDEEIPYELPSNPVHGRYFKLNETNDDNWAYLTDQGFYVRVMATKAIEGRNQNHRVDTEWIVLKDKEDELADRVITEGSLLMYRGDGLDIKDAIINSTSPDGRPYSRSYIIKMIKDAHASKYKNSLSKEDTLKRSNELFDILKDNPTLETKKTVIKNNFRVKNFSENKNKFFQTALNDKIADSTWLVALNVVHERPSENNYLVETVDGEIINVTVKAGFNAEFDEKYEMYHNGVLVDQKTIANYFTKGDVYNVRKVDEVILRPEFEAAMQNPDFKDFFEQITEEYSKIADQDHTGFLQHGKLGQVVSGDSKSFMQALSEFKNNQNKTATLANASYEGVKSFLTTDTQKKYPKVDSEGNYVDLQGRPLPPGTKPVMIARDKLNIDRLDVDDLAPSFSKRVFDQNFVTNNLLTNIMAMSSQSINFNRMYELEPQMRFAMLLSQGSTELGIDERYILNHVKSKKNAEPSKKAATGANNMLKFILKNYVYGSPEIQDSLGKNTWLEKVIEPIRKLTFFQQIALNPTSAFFSNLPVGQINNYLVASTKKFGLNSKFVLNASGQVLKEVMPILQGSIGNTNVSDSHYVVKLAYMFDAVAGLAVEAKNFQEHKTDFQHYASYQSLFMLTSATEIANQLPLMLGFMQSYELSPGYTMLDAVRLDGKKLSDSPNKTGVLSLIDEAGNTLDKVEVAKFVSKLSELLSRAQGNYGKYQKIKARYEYLIGLAMTFGQWIYPSAQARFGRGKLIDQKTGLQDFGGYQKTFIENSFGTLNEFKEIFAFGEEESFSEFMVKRGLNSLGQAGWKVAKVFASVPLHVLNLMSGFKGQENEQFRKLLSIKGKDASGQYSEEFKKLFELEQLEGEPDAEFEKRLDQAYDFYINSLQTASKEYALVIAVMVIGMMARALTDDDDENDGSGERFAKFLDVRSRQLVSDLSLFTPLLSPLKPYDFLNQKSKDPFVILRTIDINTKFLYNILGFQVNLAQGDINFAIDDRYEKSGPGYEKGDLKLKKTAMRAFGPLYQMHRLFEPEQQAAYLKMINKGAVFTDKDLSNADKYDNEDEE
jgi:hypothetical protein